MAKASAKANRPGGGAIRLVSNEASQRIEEIERAPEIRGAPPPRAPASRVVRNPAAQCVEDIPASPAAPEAGEPRLANGFRIVRNRAYQKVRRIKAEKLRAPVSDEMDYKKLFTQFEEGFLAQDLELVGECLSPAFQWRMPDGRAVYGKAEALAEMERRFAAPNGPKFGKAIWRFEGETVLQTYDVEYTGPDGRRRKSRGFDLYEIGGGLIVLKDAYWKMIP